MLPTRDPPQNKRSKQAESERMVKIFQSNGQEKKARIEIHISDKTDFKTKPIQKTK